MSHPSASLTAVSTTYPVYQYGKFHVCPVKLEPQGYYLDVTPSPPAAPSQEGSPSEGDIPTDGDGDMDMLDAEDVEGSEADQQSEYQDDQCDDGSVYGEIVIHGWKINIPDPSKGTATPPSLESFVRDSKVSCWDLDPDKRSSVTLSDGKKIHPFKIESADNNPLAEEGLARYYCHSDDNTQDNTQDYIVTDRLAVNKQGRSVTAILSDGSYGPSADIHLRGWYEPPTEWYLDVNTGIASIGIDVSNLPDNLEEILSTTLTWFEPAAAVDQSSAVGAV